MICPHCKKTLRVPERTLRNMENYRTSALIATDCCGHGVRMYPRTIFNVEAVDGAGDDDWGVSFK